MSSLPQAQDDTQEVDHVLAVLEEIVPPCDLVGADPLKPELWAWMWWRDFVLREALPQREFGIVTVEAKALAAVPRLLTSIRTAREILQRTEATLWGRIEEHARLVDAAGIPKQNEHGHEYLLEYRIELLVAERDRLHAELEAGRLREAALQESINGCAKRVSELAGKVRLGNHRAELAEDNQARLHAENDALQKQLQTLRDGETGRTPNQQAPASTDSGVLRPR